VIYCLVPQALAPKLHEPLRRHFRDDPSVEVVVERRRRERRGNDRREDACPDAPASERRRIRNLGGRRIADRRAAVVPVSVPELPRRARGYADQLVFVERVVRTGEQEEDLDTSRLVTRIQAGDREGFAELYLRYFDRVYGYVTMVLRDRHEAEDVTQQVFVHVVEPRTLERERERIENGDPDLSALGWITDRDLMLFIERLPVQHRQVLLLRYMLDLTSREVAAILGRSPADVRKIQERALRFLNKRLAALGREPRRGRQAPLRRRPTFLGVLRARRFALHP
jgi:RNA polymerase sigma-70 factor (ECF subfamily)